MLRLPTRLATTRLSLRIAVLSLLVALAGCAGGPDELSMPEDARVLVNQVGYLTYAPKTALVVSETAASKAGWRLEPEDGGEPVARGRLGKAQMDMHTGEFVQSVRFDEVEAPGDYVLRVGELESFPFSVSNAAFDQPLELMLRSYYLQRCGAPIDDSDNTGMQRPMCHIDDGTLARKDVVGEEGQEVYAPGGWHDAGDYGKYVATTAVVVIELLTRFEQSSTALSAVSLSIPESDNELPDVLDEMKVGLDWLVRMQRDDGAVYRKLSGAKWPSLVAPEKDDQERFVYGVSSPETAKAAAAWALAARVYRNYLPAAADRYLAAAESAWAYLGTVTEDQYFDFQKSDDGGSGPYMANKIDQDDALHHDRDDRLAAAVQLLITTGEPAYREYVEATVPEAEVTAFEWKDISSSGLLTYLWHPKIDADDAVRARLRKRVVARAGQALKNAQMSSYRIANHRFIWGSNKMAAEEGILLVQAWQITGDPEYLNAAIDQADYLLGRNVFGQTFVTGVGERPVQHVSHILVRATGQEVPGLFVGGPNEGAQAGIAEKDMGPRSYADHPKSYATNEYAIDYNSALIALLFDLKQAVASRAAEGYVAQLYAD